MADNPLYFSTHVRSCFVDTEGSTKALKFNADIPQVCAQDYTYTIAEGNVPGHEAWSKIGFATSIGGVEMDIAPWLTGKYIFPASTCTMTIISSNSSDNITGTGARTVAIYYLNELYQEKSATVIMTGATAVTIATDMFRINNVRVMSVGSNYAPVGNITVASANTTYGFITLGKTRQRQMIYTVPSNKTLYIDQATFSSGNQNPSKVGGVRITTRANADDKSKTVLQRGLFMPYNEIILYNDTFMNTINPPTRIPSTTDIKVSAISLVADIADITCSLKGWLE